MKKEFDQIKYISDFNKKNYVNISFRVKPEIKEEINLLMKKNGFHSYNDLLETVISIMKSKENNIKKL